MTREGDDLTIVAIGKMVAVAEETAEKLAEDQVSVEVIDLRSVSPWDQETVLDSVKKTGRLIVIDESNPQCNIAGDVASVIGDVGFDYRWSIKKVTAPDTPVPFAANLEAAYMPNADKVLDIASELIDDLKRLTHRRCITMSENIIMPKLGMTMKELLKSGFKSEGDTVKQGESIVTISSEKLTNDVEAPASGTLLEIKVQAGEDAEVKAVLGIIGEEGKLLIKMKMI